MRRLFLGVVVAMASLGMCNQAAADAGGVTTFGVGLYQKLGGDGNLVFSPYNIYSCVAMAYAGSSGKTREQIASALSLPLEQSALNPAIEALEAPIQKLKTGAFGFTLTTANASWVKDGYKILPAYSGLIQTLFKTSAFSFSTPEAAIKDVNGWVEKNTNGKIVDLLAPGSVSSDTRFILASALYMLAKWQSPFEKDATTELPFQSSLASSAPAKFMTKSAKFNYGESEGFRYVQLPYYGGVSFWVLLPNDVAGLSALEKRLSAKLLTEVFAMTSFRKVNLQLPKIDSSSSIGLSQALQALGITDAFNNSADFSGITGDRDLQISDVIHQAKVKVDEEGTEAAAATAIVFRTQGLALPNPEEPVIFTADHPFIYLVRDDASGTILFMGRLAKP